MTTDLSAVLAGARLLPVLTVPSVASAGPLAEALAEGGALCAEVTFRTPDAEQVVKAMAAHGGLTVGAGTILTPEQAERAVAAGARFLVSPGLDDEVLATCRELGVPVVPGIATATELMRALRTGVDTVKLFPAEAIGGLRTLRALAAPFPGVRFVPTGGIGPDLLADYLADPGVLAVGGSWMATPAHLDRGDYTEISRLTADAVRRSTP
ncbi:MULTISPECIES: bifunctional 4-hydroxy-2-oxoglutarate aldolase/2-dehydro-3-deoxy-phosphogluconate aldolase [Streptomyces]|uniref:2-dehydro-3-deoxyphosphogluconate aldolase/(4S)-4-hydroxy-2-oxoglutarate aldolase n=1 Tax=Streptomyces stelliscabiei TaxID=146820 RepID=A0A8I0PHI5_9ACTN|nr:MULTISPECIES: bifunctional 4-hydroxy-2-oxoglutarate aldolase/2-dehydro-3-deoxy-phosphogluconate aldolase [Streptomyces]KND41711.1 keto-deoxy-phosphogluconate aldolase [Streptomyces stelliscabiei]MBE1602385.1 2-dehydro-3-deoxyphosphogluconate aldolase/(4S)-4-hydroxy-2-oxoglutarate aldolase [Streptomyces stelliscabiei]MDX2521247.1 bifunctional 4-hydroxy-2-oxoglutarate aldolase/2-dehydro-3-deoxy-phosphogluconate aldolase [Streptomyces stelliscabiei]MDX2550355.1 bifunctional 4-hydroxy-2-oxogluta